MTNSNRPWERQEGESAQEFEAFRIYLEMGTARNIRAVGQKLSKSRSSVGRWSHNTNWVERCRAWDNHLQRIAQRSAIREVGRATRQRVRESLQPRTAALMRLSGVLATPQNSAAIVILAADLERQSLTGSLQNQWR